MIDLNGTIGTPYGFQGDELWMLLGNVHSFYDEQSDQVLYDKMRHSTYRILARNIFDGQVNGEDITKGFDDIRGRLRNWGNDILIPEVVQQRLTKTKEDGILFTHSLQPGTYYKNETTGNKFNYYIWDYLLPDQTRGTEFVLWSLSQERCLKRVGSDDQEPAAGSGCRVCDSRPNVNCTYL